MTAVVLAYLDLMPATRRGLPVAACNGCGEFGCSPLRGSLAHGRAGRGEAGVGRLLHVPSNFKSDFFLDRWTS